MKKIIFTAICLITVCLVHAQESNEYKPNAGFYTIELGLTGGLMNTGINLSESTLLRGRYFLSNQTAVRLGINISSKTDKTNFWESLGSKNKGVNTENEKSITINLGYEEHFKGTDRLSPYLGGDVLLGLGTSTKKGDDTDGDRYRANFTYKYTETNRIALGLRAVVGADYYFVKNVYLGVEAGLSILKNFSGKSKLTQTQNGQTESIESKSDGSSFEIKPVVVSGIRIGFVF